MISNTISLQCNIYVAVRTGELLAMEDSCLGLLSVRIQRNGRNLLKLIEQQNEHRHPEL